MSRAVMGLTCCGLALLFAALATYQVLAATIGLDRKVSMTCSGVGEKSGVAGDCYDRVRAISWVEASWWLWLIALVFVAIAAVVGAQALRDRDDD
jgi:hypothetical protein